MKIYSDLTDGMAYLLQRVSTGAGSVWIGFNSDDVRVVRIQEKWITDYGTNLSSEKRRARRDRKQPTAFGVAVPLLGNPYAVGCVLLASKEAVDFPVGPFSREKWETRPIKISDFVMSHEPRERRGYVWTWRIQDRQFGLLQNELVAYVKAGDAYRVKYITDKWVRLYPMFSGVRRQIRRMLNSARKLWLATMNSPWPGRDPDALPAMIGFRKTHRDKSQQSVEMASPSAQSRSRTGTLACDRQSSTL